MIACVSRTFRCAYNILVAIVDGSLETPVSRCRK